MTLREHLVRLTWIDAHAATDAWTNIDEIDTDPCLVESVGFLLDGIKQGHICIAQSAIHAQDEVDNVLAIPAAMVRRVETLTPSSLLPIDADDA